MIVRFLMAKSIPNVCVVCMCWSTAALVSQVYWLAAIMLGLAWAFAFCAGLTETRPLK